MGMHDRDYYKDWLKEKDRLGKSQRPSQNSSRPISFWPFRIFIFFLIFTGIYAYRSQNHKTVKQSSSLNVAVQPSVESVPGVPRAIDSCKFVKLEIADVCQSNEQCCSWMGGLSQNSQPSQ